MKYSILDTDLYKFTVSYAYMKMFPNAECTFTFKDRNNIKRSAFDRRRVQLVDYKRFN